MVSSSREPLYKRIVLKLSGGAFSGPGTQGIHFDTVTTIADAVKEIVLMGVQVGVIVGGGNLWRGLEGNAMGINRSISDYMGMLATVINALAFQGVLESKGIQTRVLSAIEMREVAEPFILRRAIRHLEKGRVVIFAAGTGNPFFTTDTAAALRAVEIGAEALLMAKNKVDGIYNVDPNKETLAIRYDEITYNDVLMKMLGAIDSTAVSLSREHKMKIIVFNGDEPGNIIKVVLGEKIGTSIK